MHRETEKNPQITPQNMTKIMASAEGKELLAILAGGGGLQKAMEAFHKGDMNGVKAALEPAMASERAEELLRKLNGK